MDKENTFKKVFLYAAIIIAVILLFGVQRKCSQDKISEIKKELRIERLKNDTLQKISDTQYRKLIADTLTQKQLNKRIKELGIALEAKPKVIYNTKIVVKEVDKIVDNIIRDSTSIAINTYYPQKENYFVNYQNKINLKDNTGVEHWKFSPVEISIVLSQRKDGMWQSDIKVPEFMEVGSVDVQATPFEIEKSKKRSTFGLLLGGGAGYDFRTEEIYGRISGDLRIKKFYIGVGAGSNQTVDGGIKIEL